MPHPHRGGRPRPSVGQAQAPTIIRQTLTGAATGTMPRDGRADHEDPRKGADQIDNDVDRRRDAHRADHEHDVRHWMTFRQKAVAAEEERGPGHHDADERIRDGIDQGERHLRERLVYRDRGLRRLRFCRCLLVRRRLKRVEQGEP